MATALLEAIRAFLIEVITAVRAGEEPLLVGDVRVFVFFFDAEARLTMVTMEEVILAAGLAQAAEIAVIVLFAGFVVKGAAFKTVVPAELRLAVETVPRGQLDLEARIALNETHTFRVEFMSFFFCSDTENLHEVDVTGLLFLFGDVNAQIATL